MKFFLTGVETHNKGAELMLYAILQEIERVYPNSTVFIKDNRIKQGVGYVKTSLNLVSVKTPTIHKIIKKLRINGILRRLFGRYIYDVPIIKDVDYLLDGSGLHFSDHTIGNNTTIYLYWNKLLKGYCRAKAKIVFLPQGFGPIEKSATYKAVKAIGEYADIVYAREEKSYNYLLKSNAIDKGKLHIMTDFTSLVAGEMPQVYNHLKRAVCIIPNMQMVRHGGVLLDDYIGYLVNVISLCQSLGHCAYILNHEGEKDEQLAYICKEKIANVEVVTGLNAIQTKGMISSAYLVISSRFHGVASALNSCVPCLATSWSHKYQYLYRDYKLSDSILKVSFSEDEERIKKFLNPDYNAEIRARLSIVVPSIQHKVRMMWNEIWDIEK